MSNTGYNLTRPIAELSEAALSAIVAERTESISAAAKTGKDELRALAPKMLCLLDLTSLDACDNRQSVASLCEKALRLNQSAKDAPAPAAVCVFGPLLSEVKRRLKGSGIKSAAVSCNFPTGMSPLACKIAETRSYVESGAEEIDMVISRGEFLAGNHKLVQEEIAAIKLVCGDDVKLKVILETGELKSLCNIALATRLAIDAGADFIKTSTGKCAQGATLEAATVILLSIAEHVAKGGNYVGFKASGGVATPEQALLYLCAQSEILGKHAVSPEFLRIGASRLADALASL